MGGWYIKSQITFLYEALKVKQNFRKNKVVTGKTHFVLPILFVLILASDKTILDGNDAFSILVRPTKKGYSSAL